MEAFSRVEVLYGSHRVEPAAAIVGARHSRGNVNWPLVGIFAQRAKARPNRLGSTIAGTPVLDLKPVMQQFLPRTAVRQPTWSHELVREHWT